jgi:hypothetical protein
MSAAMKKTACFVRNMLVTHDVGIGPRFLRTRREGKGYAIEKNLRQLRFLLRTNLVRGFLGAGRGSIVWLEAIG